MASVSPLTDILRIDWPLRAAHGSHSLLSHPPAGTRAYRFALSLTAYTLPDHSPATYHWPTAPPILPRI